MMGMGPDFIGMPTWACFLAMVLLVAGVIVTAAIVWAIKSPSRPANDQVAALIEEVARLQAEKERLRRELDAKSTEFKEL